MGVSYFRRGDSVEIIVRDETGAKIEKHHCNVNDRERYRKILEYLKDKYGFEPYIDVDKSVNNEKEDKAEW